MSTNNAQPRYATVPTPGASTWAADIEEQIRILGHREPYPWQSLAAELIGELRPDGTPRFNLIVLSTPRQSGKTILASAAAAAKAHRHPGGRLYGTAQKRIDAVHHLEEFGLALIAADQPIVTRFGVGTERIQWPNGARYQVLAPTKSGGHGYSADWIYIDEGWDMDRHVLGNLRPAMAARPYAQMLITSTMGTVDSETWNELTELGREAVDDPNSRMAYLEYSAPSDDAVFDPAEWPSFMPALGLGIAEEFIAEEMRRLHPADFTRAYGNVTVQSLAIVFPADWVDAAMVSAMEPATRIVLGLDVNDDPIGATITAAHLGEENIVGIRTLEWRFGAPRWVVAAVDQMASRREVDAIVADFGGPSRTLLTELANLGERHGIPLIDRKPRDLGGDTKAFHDALRDQTVKMERNEYLTAALTGAQRKDIGDLWVPHRRRMRVDPSPLISAIMAYGIAREFALTPRLPAIW